MGARPPLALSLPRGSPVLRNEFVELDIHYADKVVVVRRTSSPFTRTTEIDAAIAAIVGALPLERRKGHRVLVDMREAPIRPDPSLDPAFGRYRAETERGFDRIVVVATTVVGRMRASRIGQGNPLPVQVVTSLEEAWELLRA